MKAGWQDDGWSEMIPLFVLCLQVLLPVVLLAWLGVFAASGVLAFTLQALSVGLILLGLGLVGLWAMPPFWVPYLYGLVYLAIVIRHIAGGQVDTTVLWSSGALTSTLIVLVAGLGIAGVYLTLCALEGRRLPAVETVDIAPPLRSGTLLVAHGGSTEWVNAHLRTLDPDEERFYPWRGQSRALDIFVITSWGSHMKGLWPADPAQYETFGALVVAPCSGTVARVVDDLPDMQVPQMDTLNPAGNFVAINCGEFYVVLAHLRQGSIRARQGDVVETGEVLGEIGNSGNSSEPHLHIHAQRGLPEGAPLSGEPLGLTINGRFLVRNDRMKIKSSSKQGMGLN